MPTLRQQFLHHVGQTSPMPMMIDVDHAESIYIYDTDGKAYADLTSGICVSNLGHNHPVVKDAIKAQSDRYLHTMVYGEHVQAPQVRLATAITDQLPSSLNAVYFTNSGSEATEGAIKLARRHTVRAEILACRLGYHGSTIASMSLMSYEYYTLAYQPGLPGVGFIDFNAESAIQQITDQTAAVIMEPVRGPVGVQTPDSAWLKAIRKRCDEVGALLIFDEIQCGLGRTGHLWAHTPYEVVPDILLLAKALGGGLPLGALVADQSVLSDFTHKPMLGYISTFGGHPLCCAAGLAAFNYILEHPEIIASVKKKESQIAKHLTSPGIKTIRSCGLMAAVDIIHPDRLPQLVDTARENGLLIDYFLFHKGGFRLAPPLIITTEQWEKHLIALNGIISTVMK